MAKLNLAAETFAIRVVEGMRESYRLDSSDTREGVGVLVAGMVRRLDYSKQWAKDGGRMVEYVTDAVCSENGIE